MLARNSDLCWLVSSSWQDLSASSWKSRAFWIARADWVANVCRRATVSGENAPGRAPPDDQRADDRLLAQERDDQQRPEPGRERAVADGAGRRRAQVGDLERGALRGRLPDRGLAELDPRLADPGDQFRAHPVGRPQVERPRGRVVLADRAAVGAGQLRGARDDRRQQPVQVERAGDRLADLEQGGQARDRAGQLVGPLLQLGEQPRVLDRDHGLVGEGLEEADALGREPARSSAVDDDHA
jgi:hypothetical protein